MDTFQNLTSQQVALLCRGMNDPMCPITTMPPDGYTLIAQGNWPEFLSRFGLQSVIIFIGAFLILRFFRKCVNEYYDQKRREGK